ncbi:MAG: HAMP domain-containing histidine kinase [Polyangiaceae bacterium]|nr:HAMP domain-containing histidine kinase [Polyangiaceae bacterium]
MLTTWRTRVPLAVQATMYAATTLCALTLLQLAALPEVDGARRLVLVAPAVVCTLATYFITRGIVRHRAAMLLAAYERFRRGETDDAEPLTDPEFQEARQLFVRLSQELRAATDALVQRDIERRRLFSDVVHEIGTPVSSLLGLAEALDHAVLSETPAQRTHLAEAVAHESERLARFVADLRDIAHLDDPALVLRTEALELSQLAQEGVARLNAIPGATPVTVEVQEGAERVQMQGDRERLEQVLVNLVTNARRYAPPSAPILVRVGVSQGDGANGTVTLRVEDGGPGVPDADLPRLGERMRRLDSSRTRKTGGSGLGLSIVAAIAQRHGGTVSYARSALGGLAVTVALPEAAPRSEA